jgi:rhodanese-related sulfurtransferase
MKRNLIVLAAAAFLAVAAMAQEIETVDAKKAFELTKAPATYLVDIRSVAEYVLVGHPTMAANVPISFWSETEGTFVPNEGFLDDLKARFKTGDVLVFICRSGGRSLRAARSAREAGFTKVFNVGEGFEGPMDGQGRRTTGGWKNSGLPYTYDIDPSLVYRPKK